MKKLNEPIVLDTGLTHQGKPVSVTLQPSKNGGNLILRKGLKRKIIPLYQILLNVVEERPSDVCSADWIDLSILEAVLMVHVEKCKEDYPLKAKEVLFKIVRELREQRRQEQGLPPVVWAKPIK